MHTAEGREGCVMQGSSGVPHPANVTHSSTHTAQQQQQQQQQQQRRLHTPYHQLSAAAHPSKANAPIQCPPEPKEAPAAALGEPQPPASPQARPCWAAYSAAAVAAAPLSVPPAAGPAPKLPPCCAMASFRIWCSVEMTTSWFCVGEGWAGGREQGGRAVR